MCNMLVFTCQYNTWHVVFEVQHTACVVLRVLSLTFKQYGPCVETTSHQDNTHYVPQATHWCAESTSSHVHWSVILPSLCKINTWDEIQVLFQHMLQQTTHDGDTHGGYFNMAVFAVLLWEIQTRMYCMSKIRPPSPHKAGSEKKVFKRLGTYCI